MVILNLCPWPVGGFATYIKNLYYSCLEMGEPVTVLRLGKLGGRSENRFRTNLEGVQYKNLSYGDLLRAIEDSDTLPLLAAHHPFEGGRMEELQTMLVEKRMVVPVVHDPMDLRKFPHVKLTQRPIVIRETVAGLFKKASFIPHPYVTRSRAIVAKTHLAGSLAMVTGLKHPDIIVKANRLLPTSHRVKFLGIENRLYTRSFKERFPDFKGSKGFPRGIATAVEAIAPFKLNVDMSVFPKDGGGTQYSFLEAMDAGACNVLTTDWCSYPGPMKHGKTCLEVEGPGELANLLGKLGKHDPTLIRYVDNINQTCYKILRTVHDPRTIVSQYLKELRR